MVVSPSNSGEDTNNNNNNMNNQVMSSPSSWYCQTSGNGGLSVELLEENEKLRSQNIQLNRELTQMKSICDNIFSLMSNYVGSQTTDRSYSPGGSSSQPVEFLPAKRFSETEVEEEASPRLFGVPIGLKRTRSEGVQVKRVSTAAVVGENSDEWLTRHCNRTNQRVCN